MPDRNVRGIGIALCLLTLLLSLSGCGSLKDDTLLIANAVITEVDTGKQTITVKDDVDESTLGEECLIDCPSVPMVYCDFATQKVTRISFEDLQVNDRVIVSIRSSEMENFRSGGNEEEMLEVEQLQLYTQKTCRMSLGCPTLHRGFEIEPESMKWVIQHTNANMVETDFLETCSTSYANSTALEDNLVRIRI